MSDQRGRHPLLYLPNQVSEPLEEGIPGRGMGGCPVAAPAWPPTTAPRHPLVQTKLSHCQYLCYTMEGSQNPLKSQGGSQQRTSIPSWHSKTFQDSKKREKGWDPLKEFPQLLDDAVRAPQKRRMSKRIALGECSGALPSPRPKKQQRERVEKEQGPFQRVLPKGASRKGA